MKGKIICIEGNDRVGKHTQSILLSNYIQSLGYSVKCLSFPNYGTPQAKPVESYLAGSFPMLGPLEASILYAFDRSVTMKELEIKSFLKDGGVIVMDRYTPSNIIYQIARSFKDGEEINISSEKVFNLAYKIEHLEYNILGLPRPDAIVYLKLDREMNKRLLENDTEIKGNNLKDLHESDELLLDRVAEVGIKIARLSDWSIVECYDYENAQMYPKEKILKEIIRELSINLNIPAK